MPFVVIKFVILAVIMNSMGTFSGYQTIPRPMAPESVSPYVPMLETLRG